MVIRVVVVCCVVLFGCTQRNYVKKAKKQQVISTVRYAGGSGESAVEAVVIKGVKKKSDVVAAEYQFITQKHGERGSGWSLIGQTVVREENKLFEVIEIKVGDASGRRIYYFDVTEFLWNGK